MGLVDDKKNVFTTIGAYTSLREEKNLPDTTNLFPSINNKDDIGGFLLDVLGVVVGTTALQELTGQLFNNFVDDAEPKMKASMNKQLINQNSGSKLPISFKNGEKIPISDIDPDGILKNDTNSSTGSLLFGNTNSFNRTARNAISNPGVGRTYQNLIITYDDSDDTFIFRPTISSSNDNVGNWFNTYVGGANFIEKKSFTAKVLNGVFGSITANEDKTQSQILNSLINDQLLSQLIDGDDSFEISNSDLENLESKAKQLKSGLMEYDMGCGIITGELPIEDLESLVNNIYNSTDPNYIENQINNTISNSFSATDNQETSDENSETIRNGFFARLIQIIKLELSKILTLSPQARMLLALSSSFQNNGNSLISNPQNDMKTFRVTIKCLLKDMLALLYEFIFNLILTFLIALIAPIIKTIIKEKINQYIGVIKSLISSNI